MSGYFKFDFVLANSFLNYFQHNTLTVILVVLLIISLVLLTILVMALNKATVFNERISDVYVRTRALKSHVSKSNLDLSAKNEKLEDENRGLELFLNKASHDLKGPLKSIRGLVELGLRDNNIENHKSYFNKISNTALGLEDLINEVINLSAIRKQRLKPSATSVNRVLGNILDDFSNFPGIRDIDISLRFEEEVTIYTDLNLFRSIIQNFIENAIKYRNKNRKDCYLRIIIESTRKYCKITFEDNGVGISSEHLPYIFDMFYRVDEDKNGSGLGLFIVKESTIKLRGKIKVRSSAGVGSSFKLILPVRPSQEVRTGKEWLKIAGAGREN